MIKPFLLKFIFSCLETIATHDVHASYFNFNDSDKDDALDLFNVVSVYLFCGISSLTNG